MPRLRLILPLVFSLLLANMKKVAMLCALGLVAVWALNGQQNVTCALASKWTPEFQQRYHVQEVDYHFLGLDKLTDTQAALVTTLSNSAVYVGCQRKKGDDYSKVRIFVDAVSDSPAVTHALIERVARNPFVQIVYSWKEADLVFHVYSTQRQSGSEYFVAVTASIPALWTARPDAPLEYYMGNNTTTEAGATPEAAVGRVYEMVLYPQIETVHKTLSDFEKDGKTMVLLPQ
jgi:hypothetical protein